MTNPRPRATATEAGRGLLLSAVLLLAAGAAWAAPVGTVVDLSGPLLARKADGGVKVLARRSVLEDGDTLVAEKHTYARLRFADDGEITLKPGTTFRIAHFAYDPARPEGDSAAFELVRGGVRSVTGRLGKRNRDRFALKTPAASVGVHGTTFIVEYLPGASASVPVAAGSPAAPAPGLYVQVLDGAIFVANGGGAQNFQTGQFGYVPSQLQPPVLVPQNPGLQFTPPPAFNMSGTGTPASGSQQTAGAVDCVVR